MAGAANFREEMEKALEGRVCLMGVGNAEYGDDGFGVRLAEALIAAGVKDVIVAGSEPERYLTTAAGAKCDGADFDMLVFDHVVFLDAVEFGGVAGSVVWLDRAEMGARYPQISTHKISLGVLAGVVESNGRTKAWLLGVQPESVKEGEGLSATVEKTLGALVELMVEMRTRETTVC
jgi:hydrogenase maturation protease